ncbi:MAG TPA: V-type ATP synthase subunit F [Methanomicrobia archaeon]|nr:V-type ATP synthase subunit F [Methanomicrobia archaeon]
MNAVAVIGDPDTATGFRLAGVNAVYEQGLDGEQEDTAHVLDRLAREDFAIILITEQLAADPRTREKIRDINAKKKGVRPIILEIPDKRGPMEKELDEIQRLIQRAVGVAVK